jgi:hypothetical protein
MSDPIPAPEWVTILDGDGDIVDLDLGRFPLPKQHGSRYTAKADWANEIDIDWWGERPPPDPASYSDPFLARLAALAGCGVPPIDYPNSESGAFKTLSTGLSKRRQGNATRRSTAKASVSVSASPKVISRRIVLPQRFSKRQGG